MPVRVLQHGFAPSTENYGMEPGAWSDIPVHAQFLIDLEFLMRYTQPSGASCLYCQSPPYLKEIASHFPWVHFYAYGHAPDPSPEEEEYDPAQPQLVTRSAPDVQVNGNTTTAAYPFTKEIAVRLGENSATVNRVMVCHGLDSMRQLCLHSMLRPRFSLLDVQGPIPEDYIEGELMLPMFIANHKIFVSLVASQQSGARRYNPSLFKDEMGFFQAFVRVTDAYDHASKDIIATEYARHTHRLHGCPEDILRMGLLSTMDLLSVRQPAQPICF